MNRHPLGLCRVLGPNSQRATHWPLYDTAGNRALESLGSASWPEESSLMQRAGMAVARLARAVAPHAQQVWVLAGPGNNGGDGFEAARQLRLHAGLNVHVSWLGTEDPLPPDARAALHRAQASGVSIDNRCMPPNGFSQRDLSIDALLGRGLNRTPDGMLAHGITAFNAAPAPILAVDLPSGLRADSGTLTESGLGIQARWTLALLGLAPGLFTAHGRDLCGEIWWDSLGMDVEQIAPTAWLASTAQLRQRWPVRCHAQHKGSFGDVWVVGGAPGMSGAAHLAGLAALQGGAGRVHLTSLAETAVKELMTRPLEHLLKNPRLLHHATVVAGCGGGDDIEHVLPVLLETAPRLVLDADALNAVARDASLRHALKERHQHDMATILTPHPLEAARLLGGWETHEVQADRINAATHLAHALNCVVVLKGSGSIVTTPGHLAMLHPVGNVSLATPGSGDVLAGFLGGLWSQLAHLEPQAAHIDSARQAAHTAVHWHGLSAERLSPRGEVLRAETLARQLIVPPFDLDEPFPVQRHRYGHVEL
ncbi:MAG: NAD(P)H-hydrate dehydratase [Leptothrix ochracea]|uniref:NAD(P)H-hydrate dehydratase n=2 Tax=Leptothrix ochracea TaxID=735331 RepID=UPI0034E28898